MAFIVAALIYAADVSPRGNRQHAAVRAKHREVHGAAMRFLADIQGWLYGSAIANLKAVAAGIDPVQLVAAMAVAAVFGLVHALMPGHGKAVLVSYYLGHSGRVIGSVGTSAILVLTHVGSAIVLVLAGFTVVRATIGGAGRAPAFEIASAVLILALGLWMLWRAMRPHGRHPEDGPVLAAATGLVPCPLTTFIMIYAVGNGIVLAGLLVTASMAAGMTLTIAAFALGAVLLRERLVSFLARTEQVRGQIGRGLEAASAVAIMALGVWMLATR
jgi:nickel/cobalt transporter (NicO) family protein